MSSDNTKKTIFLTIIRGQLARNFLQNDFYTILCKHFNLVIFTPAAHDERFLKTFGRPNVTFVHHQEQRDSRLDAIFFGLQKYLIYNTYIGLKLRYGIRGLSRTRDISEIRYWLFTIIFKPLSKLHFLRDWVRWLDFHFGQRVEVGRLGRLIEEHKPILIISTSPLSSADAALVKAAKKKSIPTIGMPKSWDNLPKAGFRAKPEELIVWGEFMVEKSVQFQNYTPKGVAIVGIPQFDYYTDISRIWSREEFCRRYILDSDPDKPIVLFCSEGKAIPEDRDFASILSGFIQGGELRKPCQLLLRPHFIYKDDHEKFVHLTGKTGVAIDLSNEPSLAFKDHADYSQEHMDRLLNSLYHCSILVTTSSTMVLDGVAFDKPLINIAFDGYKDTVPYRDSFVWRYRSDYYAEVLKTEATTVVHSREELREALNRYLDDPTFRNEEREELRRRFCYRIDGRAGKRFADRVIQATHSSP